VEGEHGLLIEKNFIIENQTGLVLLHSGGEIKGNRIYDNEKVGVSIVSESTAILKENTIEMNEFGIEISQSGIAVEPATPELVDNNIQKNEF